MKETFKIKISSMKGNQDSNNFKKIPNSGREFLILIPWSHFVLSFLATSLVVADVLEILSSSASHLRLFLFVYAFIISPNRQMCQC